MDIERPSWDEYFMMQSILAGTRATCHYVKTGSVIVQDKRIIATGYNGAPSGIENCLVKGCRKKSKNIDFETKGTGTCRGEHAERNALLQVLRKDTTGASLYSVLYPCSECAKMIVGAEISKVYFMNHYKEPDSLTQELFSEKRIEVIKLKLDLEKVYNYMVNVAKKTS